MYYTTRTGLVRFRVNNVCSKQNYSKALGIGGPAHSPNDTRIHGHNPKFIRETTRLYHSQSLTWGNLKGLQLVCTISNCILPRLPNCVICCMGLNKKKQLRFTEGDLLFMRELSYCGQPQLIQILSFFTTPWYNGCFFSYFSIPGDEMS